MCGRFYIADDDREEELRAIIDELQRRESIPIQTGEVFPSNIVPVIANSRTMQAKPFAMKWGYSLSDGKLLINARSETAAQKTIFADGMKQRRCLIPASHYFEWERKSRQKTKYAIKAMDSDMIYMAGIYRMEQSKPVFTILTREPASSIAFIHDRMPVILPKAAIRDWLNPKVDALDMLKSAVQDIQFSPVGNVQESLL